MPLEANDTHKYQRKANARAAADQAGLDLDDLTFYVALRQDGKRLWGWCTNDLAEIAAAADKADPAEVSSLEVLKREQESEATPITVMNGAAAGDLAPADEGDEELDTAAIVARNAARLSAAAPTEAPVTAPAHDAGMPAAPVSEALASVTEAPAALVTEAPPVVMEATAPVREAPTTDGMVVLAVDGGDAATAALLARYLRAAIGGGEIIASRAGKPEPEWVLPALDHTFARTLPDGASDQPSPVEAVLIATAYDRPDDLATSASAFQMCDDLAIKPPRDWCSVGEAVQRFDLEYTAAPRQISRTRVDISHRLSPATA
jgi:hypothetical protein